MKTRSSMWITKAAAVAALIGGLGGVARATILSTGGFPGGAFSTGVVRCVITNTGTRDVVLNSASLLDQSGAVLNQDGGWIVPPGQTRVTQAVSLLANVSPSACIFDVSTKTGVRAAFVYDNGFGVTVIPAQK
jgi:hypothetical protein